MTTTKIYPTPSDRNTSINTKYDLTQTTRRPSENLYNVLGHSTNPSSSSSSSYESIRHKRPNSEDSSISRTTEVFSTLESSTSLPSLTSVDDNTVTSAKTTHHQHYLTPSQRYRLHKNQSQIRNLINNDTANIDVWQNDDDDDQIENINQDFLWNIPSATTTTASYGLDTLQPQDKLPTVTMIPGVTQDYQNDDQYMARMCNSLSSTYLNETKRKSQIKMDARLKSSEFLPLQWKQLDNLGLQDMKCVSTEKIQMTSPGRPQWLPPKSRVEIKQHTTQINQQMDSMYHDELERNQWLQNYKLNIKSKYTMLSMDKYNNNNNKDKNTKFYLKIVKEMPLPIELRFNIISKCLSLDEAHLHKIYNETCHKLTQLQCFPPDKSLEINRLIQSNTKRQIFGNDKINPMLPYILKLRSISNQGICRGDDIIIYHLLNVGMPPEHIFTMLQLIQSMIMNNITDYERVAKKQSLRKTGWENWEEDSKFSNWWNVMERIDNPHLFLWIFDMLILLQDDDDTKKHNNCIKFMISLPLLIIRDYHFGWDTLRTLHDVSGYKVLFPGDDSTDLLHKNHNFMNKLTLLSKSL